MPYKDPEQKLEAMRQWRGRVMPKGYGKWLYARRKLRFDDAERFGFALQQIQVAESITDARAIAQDALEQSKRAEIKLGPWVPDE